MAKILISLTVLFLTLSAVFGVLNTNKARALRETAERNDAARMEAERARARVQKQLETRDATPAKQQAPPASDSEGRVATAEAELIKSQSEKAELQTQLRASQDQIAQLQRRLEETTAKEPAADILPMPGAGDLETQLEQTRRQLDDAEREKQLLARELRGGGNNAPRTGVAEAPRKTRAAPRNPNLRGTVLAVNQAYNFVVLNLGGREGIEANSELLVLRGGTLIGRIRVSSVEPATAIGDIINNTLQGGTQVQPGDSVIYAGSNAPGANAPGPNAPGPNAPPAPGNS